VKRPDRRLCVRGTSSNTISAYRDCTTLLDPADPPVFNLLGGSLSDLPRPCWGLWVRDSLTVGVCDAPVFGESVMLTSPVVALVGAYGVCDAPVFGESVMLTSPVVALVGA
jgi:hypothetical protein